LGKWRPNVPRDRFGEPDDSSVYLVKNWQLEKKFMTHWLVTCKYCGGEGMQRWGITPKGKQRFYCPSCERTFVDNDMPKITNVQPKMNSYVIRVNGSNVKNKRPFGKIVLQGLFCFMDL